MLAIKTSAEDEMERGEMLTGFDDFVQRNSTSSVSMSLRFERKSLALTKETS